MAESEDSTDVSSLFPGYEDVDSFSQAALRAIFLSTKASNDIPSAGDDYDYYSTFSGFRALMSKEGKSILSTMTGLIQRQFGNNKIENLELEEKFDLLMDVNDSLLENVGHQLDEAEGLKKNEPELVGVTKRNIPISTSWNRRLSNPGQSTQTCTLLSAKNITRPQLTFKDKIDNTNTVFVPIIKEKPNSIKPLAITLERENDKEGFCHPYEWEIERFHPQEENLQPCEPWLPKLLEETPFVIVNEVEALNDLFAELKKQTEFAIDIEHHSYRSFQGFACLIQISTRNKDYIIDALELRSELNILNEVFTNPKITKILHGGDMDILWLQRDFGLYIVNLFDTGQASRVLNFAHFSLAYLLKHYCKIDVNKQFQLADWRIRPLPAELLKYAREDTHYLLYVYDCLKNDLLKNGNELKNLLLSVYQRSKEVCLKKYEKPLFSEDRYLELYKKSKKMFNSRQLFCLKGLYAWRDKLARQDDESFGYVLPNHMLLQIAEVLPREQQGILACCNPIPPLVKQQLNELHTIILKASECSLTQLDQSELHNRNQAMQMNTTIDLNNILHCPHDVSGYEGRRMHLISTSGETVPISSKDTIAVPLKSKPSLRLFSDEVNDEDKSTIGSKVQNAVQKVASIIQKTINPYQRYKLTQQYHAMQEVDEEEKLVPLANRSIEIIDMSSPVKTEAIHGAATPMRKKARHQKTPVASKECEVNASDDDCIEIIDVIPPVKTEAKENKFADTPLRKKKKKNKKRIPTPDVSFAAAPEYEDLGEPPVKKSRTPDVSVIEQNEEAFKPFDYSQTDLNIGKKKKNKSKKKQFNPEFKPEYDENRFKNSKKFRPRNRKHGKQATFNDSGAGTSRGKMNWPKN